MLLSADNSMRPIDWRWQLAQSLADSGADLTVKQRGADRQVMRAARYIRQCVKLGKKQMKAGDKARTDNGLDDSVHDHWPDIFEAHQIEREDGSDRWILEALVMAGQSSEDMTKDLTCCLATIDTYEALFFDVRDRLDKIAFRVSLLKNVFTCALRKDDCDQYWKFVAIMGGIELLHTLWYSQDVDYIDKIHTATLGVASRHGLQAAVSRPIDKYTVTDAISQSPIMQQLTAMNKDELPAAQQTSDALAANAMEAMSFTMRAISDVAELDSGEGYGDVIKRLADKAEFDTKEDVVEVVETQDDNARVERAKRVKAIGQRLQAQKGSKNESKPGAGASKPAG
jgi:hypothetical protein